MRIVPLLFIGALVTAGCSQSSEQAAAPASTTPAATAKPALNIKPFGTADANFRPDYSKLNGAG